MRSVLLAIIVVLTLAPPAKALGKDLVENTIVYAFGDVDWFPFVYRSPEGTCNGRTGIFIDVLHEVFKDIPSLTLTCLPLPWKRAQEQVKAGSADFLITIPTLERKGYTSMVDAPVYHMAMSLFTYADHKKLNAIKNVRNVSDIIALNLVPVTNLGNGWHKENIDKFGVPTYYVREDKHVFQFLAAKRADIVIDAIEPSHYLIQTLNLTSVIRVKGVELGFVDFHLLMSNKSLFQSYLPQISDKLSELKTSGLIATISKKHMSTIPSLK